MKSKFLFISKQEMYAFYYIIRFILYSVRALKCAAPITSFYAQENSNHFLVSEFLASQLVSK
ncbi:hypothetical protein [Winogradskyella sediminis]|uniref:hypothetical protein n=1 Tax=Winogradskyella sediminis TaxID=1382466 RepID=UPI003AA88955